MSAKTIIVSWFITLLLGLFIVTLVSGEMNLGLVFSAMAAVTSIPYLLIMMIASANVKSFVILQIIHLGLASITGLLIFGADERFFSELFWVVFPYFGIGLAVQAYWWYKVELKKQTGEINTPK